MSRAEELACFYDLLDRLARRTGGPRCLADCHGRMRWPERGVYFFLDPQEPRTDSGSGPRVVRVGTHAITGRSRTTLWQRLSQHRGVTRTGGGNHRGSIFRLLVGAAMMGRNGSVEPRSWGVGADAGSAAHHYGISRATVLDAETPLEQRVSEYIRSLPFMWLEVDDPPGPASGRATIEQGAIRLLSNFNRPVLDQPSARWLGLDSDRNRVRVSGLWNNNHVDEPMAPRFLADMKRLVERSTSTVRLQ